MPAWNAGPYIAPAIESVLAQTIDDWRLLIVDDCSSDGTPDVVAGYDDPRIQLVRLDPNRGQTGALNHGLGLVETPWIARLDQDDLSSPDRLERQLRHVDARPQTTVVGAWADFVDERGAKLGSFRPATEPDAVRRDLYARSLPIAHSCALMRTDAVRAVGGYGTRFRIAQDYELWARLAARGEVANVAAVLVSIRQHPDQASGGYEALVRQVEEQLTVMDGLPALLGLGRDERRHLAARRLRLTSQLAIAAARAGDRPVAADQARASLTALRAEPALALTLGRSATKRAARLTADAVERASRRVLDRYRASA
jgi:hypothetical protein